MGTNSEKYSLTKMPCIPIITAVVLGLIFLIGIIFSNLIGLKQVKGSTNVEAGIIAELTFYAQDYFDVNDETAAQITFDTSKVDVNTVGEYEALAKYKSKTYKIKVNVVDTTAPKVAFASRYIFTNDVANTEFASMMKTLQDASECKIKAIRFERKENLKVMDENALNVLVGQINTHAKPEDLLNMGTEEVPETEGIYKAVLEIADVHGNATYEEIILVLDKTGAKIEDVADKTITVSKEDMSKEPTVDKSEYDINDNVDGKVAAENILTELKLRDEAKHEWLVNVSYVDRAGNESKAEFLIIVKEVSTSESGGNASNGGSSNGGGNTDTSNNNAGNTNTQPQQKPSNNQDISTWVPSDDETEISPYMQMLIDAGYGNVVDWGDGKYAVLVHKDMTANGKKGYEIIDEYLVARDLESVGGYGGIIDEANDWYFYEVLEVRELITLDEEEFWD